MNKYEVQGIVGQGAYGVVIRCRHKESGKIRAIKKFRESEDDEAVRKTAVREVKILKLLRHSSIVQLHEAFRRKGRLYLVFEFMPMNLLDMLEGHPRGLSLPDARNYLHQLVHAVDWCHQHSVVHRDIKPENLLVDEARGLLKLCDFGFSRMLPMGERPAELTDYVATRWYRSPELLLGSTRYGFEVDIWAIGCIMGELLDGAALFPGESDIDQLYVIQTVLGPLTEEQREAFLSCDLYTGVQLPEVEEDAVVGLEAKYERKLGGGETAIAAAEFMNGVLAIDSNVRLTAEHCTDHPFFDDVDQPSLDRQQLQRQQTPRRQHQRGRNQLQPAQSTDNRIQTRLRQPSADGQLYLERGANNIVHQRGGGNASSSEPMPQSGGLGPGPRSGPTSVYKNSWRRQAIPQRMDTRGDRDIDTVSGYGDGDRPRSESVPILGSRRKQRSIGDSTGGRAYGRNDGAKPGLYGQRPSSQGITWPHTLSDNSNWQYKKHHCNNEQHRNGTTDTAIVADYRCAKGDMGLDLGLSVAAVREAAAGEVVAADAMKFSASLAMPYPRPQAQAGEYLRDGRDVQNMAGGRTASTQQLQVKPGVAFGSVSKDPSGRMNSSAALPFMLKRQLPALGVAVPQAHRKQL